MRALLAICRQTIRTSVRQRVFHLLLLFVMLAVTVLPLTISGDGTAAGEVKILLTYTLGIITALISAATIWIACSAIAREVEGYQMHLVLTTSTPRWTVWLGKWLGVFLLNAFLFCTGAAVACGVLYWKMNHWRYGPEEMAKLRHEVLVGRREFYPVQPDFRQAVDREYNRRQTDGSLNPNHNPKTVRDELLRQIRARATEVPKSGTRFWVFPDVKVPAADTALHLRYRCYVGGTSRSDQKFTEGVWAIRDWKDGEDSFAVFPQRVMSGSFYEITIPATYIDPDGRLVIGYTNEDAGDSSIMFQLADGPTLLAPATGFLSNYARAVVLVLLQLAFLAALGCTVGAVFSSPVALFVAASYLVIGLLVQTATNVPVKDDFGTYQYKSILDRGAHYVALGVSKAVVSVDDFDASADLIRGRLITTVRIVFTAGTLILLRTLPMAVIGVWIFTRRELGLVIRG